MTYTYRFDFDYEGEPPKVLIQESGGPAIIEVFEEPLLFGEAFVDGGDKWSRDHDDWTPGKFTMKLLDMLNAAGESNA